ncbi:isopenicillin N synthase family oxygenase [Neochlamydia sp. S13]|uniref:isopenicillin N synthase family dioxygenase n=1 Tax=Neochlamydia sp. S13 TaxID=1353976 RepID=UPI0009AC73B6|nr:2-oxoglutarate and iron-dependent oxygenase domain-containing protein [Neochlamydia sp. S13]BBI16594.1 Uncharacterized protein NCS13_1_0399 [Neochlamydia sp. S13]
MSTPINYQASTQFQTDLYNSSLALPNATPRSSPTDSIAKAEKRDELFPSSVVVNLPTLIIDNAPVPLFDLIELERAQGEQRKAIIKQFGDGLKDVGFVAIKAESLIPLIEAAHIEMEKYFSQPLEEKLKDRRASHVTGFSERGRETAAGAKVADLKETYFIPPNYDTWPENWPQNPPKFKEIMSGYHKELTKLAALFMGYLAEYLEEPTEDISKSINDAFNLLRLAHYPSPRPEDEPQAVWASAHEDLNALTLLPPSTVPGLQLMTKEGEWKAVNIPQGYLIVNTGEQLQLKTAGLIRATRHQVVNPGGKYARQRRFASIFFASWSSEFSLQPFATCIDKVTAGMPAREKEEYMKNFPNITVQENLDSRLIEMGTISNPSMECIKELRQKGLLRRPPEELIALYPSIFSDEQKGT